MQYCPLRFEFPCARTSTRTRSSGPQCACPFNRNAIQTQSKRRPRALFFLLPFPMVASVVCTSCVNILVFMCGNDTTMDCWKTHYMTESGSQASASRVFINSQERRCTSGRIESTASSASVSCTGLDQTQKADDPDLLIGDDHVVTVSLSLSPHPTHAPSPSFLPSTPASFSVPPPHTCPVSFSPPNPCLLLCPPTPTNTLFLPPILPPPNLGTRPSENRKEGLGDRLGSKCTERNVWNL